MDNLVQIKETIHSLPKGELHVHLNGLISTDIIKSILIRENTSIPEGFDIDLDLNHLRRCSSLRAYLKPWEILRLIPTKRENLNLLVENAFINLKKDNVQFVELRNSVFYISRINNISLTDALRFIILDIEEWSKKLEIKAGLILTVSRSNRTKEELNGLLRAYRELECPNLVIGLDIAGDEDIEIDPSIGGILKMAKEKYNLGITIHAGETGKVQNVFDAIRIYHADRIGHGTAAGSSLELMTLLKDRDICVEVCPISNSLTNAVGVGIRHPVSTFLENEVPFVICSDNPSIHKKSLSEDYLNYYMETNDFEGIKEMFILQKKYSFLFK